MRSRTRNVVLATTLGVAGLAGGAVLAPALATAATTEQTAAAAVTDRVERLSQALQGLVDDGTLNDAQRD